MKKKQETEIPNEPKKEEKEIRGIIRIAGRDHVGPKPGRYHPDRVTADAGIDHGPRVSTQECGEIGRIVTGGDAVADCIDPASMREAVARDNVARRLLEPAPARRPSSSSTRRCCGCRSRCSSRRWPKENCGTVGSGRATRECLPASDPRRRSRPARASGRFSWRGSRRSGPTRPAP